MKNFVIGMMLLAICMRGETTSNLCSTDETNCGQALRHASVCQDAELYCSNWQDYIQKYSFPLPSPIRRQSPWNANCTDEEYYCPLTFQCLNKADNCTFSTPYIGGGQGDLMTPWGIGCSINTTYCPLYAKCIPSNEPCSLSALGTYLSDINTGYFGSVCSSSELFCPGTQSCILNTTSCTLNESLSILNITCFDSGWSYCIDERKCTNKTCTSPVRQTFSFNDLETGWQEFCSNFHYICPKILSIRPSCMQVLNTNPGCLPLCGPSPEANCYCANDTYNTYCPSPTSSSAYSHTSAYMQQANSILTDVTQETLSWSSSYSYPPITTDSSYGESPSPSAISLDTSASNTVTPVLISSFYDVQQPTNSYLHTMTSYVTIDEVVSSSLAAENPVSSSLMPVHTMASNIRTDEVTSSLTSFNTIAAHSITDEISLSSLQQPTSSALSPLHSMTSNFLSGLVMLYSSISQNTMISYSSPLPIISPSVITDGIASSLHTPFQPTTLSSISLEASSSHITTTSEILSSSYTAQQKPSSSPLLSDISASITISSGVVSSSHAVPQSTTLSSISLEASSSHITTTSGMLSSSYTAQQEPSSSPLLSDISASITISSGVVSSSHAVPQSTTLSSISLEASSSHITTTSGILSSSYTAQQEPSSSPLLSDISASITISSGVVSSSHAVPQSTTLSSISLEASSSHITTTSGILSSSYTAQQEPSSSPLLSDISASITISSGVVSSSHAVPQSTTLSSISLEASSSHITTTSGMLSSFYTAQQEPSSSPLLSDISASITISSGVVSSSDAVPQSTTLSLISLEASSSHITTTSGMLSSSYIAVQTPSLSPLLSDTSAFITISSSLVSSSPIVLQPTMSSSVSLGLSTSTVTVSGVLSSSHTVIMPLRSYSTPLYTITSNVMIDAIASSTPSTFMNPVVFTSGSVLSLVQQPTSSTIRPIHTIASSFISEGGILKSPTSKHALSPPSSQLNTIASEVITDTVQQPSGSPATPLHQLSFVHSTELISSSHRITGSIGFSSNFLQPATSKSIVISEKSISSSQEPVPKLSISPSSIIHSDHSSSKLIIQSSITPAKSITHPSVSLTSHVLQPTPQVFLIQCQLLLTEVDAKPLSEAYPSVTSAFKVAVAHIPTLSATWSAYYDGSWHVVRNISTNSALVLGSMDKFRIASSTNIYGEVPVLIANVSSESVSGSRVNVVGQTLGIFVILYIPAVSVPPPFFISQRNQEKMLLFKENIYIKELFNKSIYEPKLKPNLNLLTGIPQNTCINNYLAKTQYINQCVPRISTTIDGAVNVLSFDTGSIPFAFIKNANISFGLEFVCANETYRNRTNLVYRLFQKEDCKSSIITAPYIPYQTRKVEYFVYEIAGFEAKDRGIGIVYTKKDYGYFQWKIASNSTWQNISLSPQLSNKGSALNVILLKPYDKIRFIMNGSKSEWNADDALNKASIKFHVWDIADNKANGPQIIHLGNDDIECNRYPLSFCCYPQFLVQIPIGGCDRKAGSTLRNNSCGECTLVENQIYQRCNDCNAVIDGCSKCTGGSTGRKYNYLKDCLNFCGLAFTDSCGNCQLKAKARNFTDCNGVCNGKALKNKCGHCVNGTTGLPNNLGMDVCGVCNGNGSSCRDCNGVPNGDNVIDHCGQCLLRNDPNFNNCTKFIDMPSCWAIENDMAVKVIGLAGLQGSKCRFVHNTNEYQAQSVFVTHSAGISNLMISVPSIASNDYFLNCNFTSGSKQLTLKTPKKIRMYSNLTISITSSHPKEIIANSTFDLTIQGSGFPSCSELQCITQHGISLKATFVSGSIVKCQVPKMLPSLLKVSLAFSTRREFDNTKAATVSIFLFGANVTTTKFQSSQGKITFTLDAESSTSNTSCSAFFKNTSKLGNSPRCTLTNAKQLTVYLGRGAVIVPGDSLVFIPTSINRNGITKYTIQEQSITIQSPDKPIVPKAVLSSSATVGSCADIELSGRDSYGGAGRPLQYYWNATVDQSYQTPLTAIQQTAFDDVRSKLAAASNANQQIVTLQANSSLIGIPVRFILTVENFLKQKGSATKTVTRVNKNIPTVSVGPSERQHLTTEDLIIDAKASLQAKCLQGASIDFAYKWSSNQGLVLNPNTLPTLYIAAGTLQGGQIYDISLTVSLTNDATVSTTSTLKVTAVAPPLNVFISVPPKLGIMEVLDFAPEDPGIPGVGLPGTCSISFEDDKSLPVTTFNGTIHKSLTFSGCRRFQIPVRNYFTSGTCYKLTLNYGYDGQTASIQKDFCIAEKEVPKVYVTAPAKSNNFAVSSKLVITATVYYTEKIGYFVWNCHAPSGCGLNRNSGEKDEITGTINRKCSTGCHVVLILQEGILPWGTKLNFTLTVSSAAGISSTTQSAYLIVTTSDLPRGGTFNVEPMIGDAMATKFQLIASQWFTDEDHMPLKYKFGYIDDKKREVFFGMSLSTSKTVSLPSGDASNENKTTVFVDIIDKYGAKQRVATEIVVRPREIDDESFQKEISNSARNIATDPLGQGEFITNIMVTHASSKKENAPVTKKEVETKQNICLEFLKSLGNIKGKSMRRKIMIVSSAILRLMTRFNTPSEFFACAAKISQAMIGIEQSQSNRRRRSLSTTVVDPISASEAELHLSTFSVLDPSKNDSNTIEARTSFLKVVLESMRGMCRASIPLGPALIAKSEPAVIQAITVDLVSINNSEIQLGCTNCPTYMQNASYISSGQSLVDLYSSYVCNPNQQNCSTVCLSSAQMPLDYLSSPIESGRLSSVVHIVLWNPNPAYAANELPVSKLSQPMIVRIPLTQLLHNQQYLCKRWDSMSKAWVESDVSTYSQHVTSAGSTSYIKCAVNRTGYITVFKGSNIPSTTMTPSTTMLSSTQSAVGKPSMTVQMSFPIDCNAFITGADKAKFEESMKQGIEKKLSRNSFKIMNVQARCGSVIVSFDVVGTGQNDTLETVNQTVMAIKTLVESGALVITVWDGRNITATTSSFIIITLSTTAQPTVSTSNAPAPKPDDDGLSAGAIAGIVIASVVALAIIGGLVYFFFFRKQTKSNRRVSPQEDALELEQPGAIMVGYHGSP